MSALDVISGAARWHVEAADALTWLRTLPAESVHCCVSSPPYWGLRDYGVVGQYGLEATPAEWVAKQVEVFEEVRRVLRGDGTCWVNLGDAYATGTTSKRTPTQTGKHGYWENPAVNLRIDGREIGLKPKDLIGLPWMLAFAMRSAGWYLRSDIIWSKPNPMPESVTDRPTKAHEYLFLFSKSGRYEYNAEAIKTGWTSGRDDMREKGIRTGLGYLQQEPVADNSRKYKCGLTGGAYSPPGQAPHGKARDKQRGHSRRHTGFNDRWDKMKKSEQQVNGANARTVWTIPTEGYPGAHFATFPTALPRRCILAGCPTHTCSACGVSTEEAVDLSALRENRPVEKRCQECGTDLTRPGAIRGGLVLDPYVGSGTTLAVAVDLGCRGIGSELNPEYAAMARRRIESMTPSMFGT